MRTIISDFIRRGLIACGFGPVVLAMIYLAIQRVHGITAISISEACLGIITSAILAFIAGGVNTIYKIERLPIMIAILIHGSVLYGTYLSVYLINGWLQQAMIPILVFSVIFVVVYIIIWAIIYLSIRKKTNNLNKVLQTKQKTNQ